MAESATLLVDNEQDSCTSLSDLIWDLDYPVSGAYDGPAARELSRRYTAGLAVLDYRSPGTAGVRVTGFARLASVK
jgi:DNA-binding response OmpR family regulator